jgi:hypothetical protein
VPLQEVLATTVQTLSAQYKQTLESHASEIEMLKAAAIEVRFWGVVLK